MTENPANPTNYYSCADTRLTAIENNEIAPQPVKPPEIVGTETTDKPTETNSSEENGNSSNDAKATTCH